MNLGKQFGLKLLSAMARLKAEMQFA